MFQKVDLKLPEYLKERFGSLEAEPGLIDDCKYMLYLADGWCWDEDYWCFPVKSKHEAIEYLKDARRRTEEEIKMHP